MKWIRGMFCDVDLPEPPVEKPAEREPETAEEFARGLFTEFEKRFATLQDYQTTLLWIERYTQRNDLALERIEAFFKALQLEFIETADGGLVIKVPFRYTKISAEGKIERCN